MGQKSTHTASVADGICLQAVRGTGHMHPERHSKGLRHEGTSSEQGDELQETEGRLCIPRSQTKTWPSMHATLHAFTADQREQQPGIRSCESPARRSLPVCIHSRTTKLLTGHEARSNLAVAFVNLQSTAAHCTQSNALRAMRFSPSQHAYLLSPCIRSASTYCLKEPKIVGIPLTLRERS